MSRFIVLLAFACCFTNSELGAAVLSGQFAPRQTGSAVHLTTTGALDWVHWGVDSTNNNRKWSSPIIGELSVIGTNTVHQVTNEVAFSWADGTPIVEATNVFTTVAVAGETNGFLVSVPADTSLDKLVVYVGAYAAAGNLEITIDDGVTPPYVDLSLSSLTTTNGVYVIDFAADKNNDVLNVKFTASTLYDTNGYVSLQAIALTTNAAPSIALFSPLAEANLVLGAATTLSASAFDSDGTITNVQFFDGEVLIGEAAVPPYSIDWTSTNLGPHGLSAVATDSNGSQATSTAVTVFVTGTNGAVLRQTAVAPATINLTTEGSSDWVHWGLYTGNSVDRKTAVAPQISDAVLIGGEPAYNFWDNATAYSWTDGQPTISVTGSPTGIYVVGLGNGFQLTVPADPNPRTLKVYVGAFGARGKFTAVLSDYSAPVVIDRSVENFGNGPATVYTLDYAAAANDQTLTVTFTCDRMYDGYGNVTLQAAALLSSIDPLYIGLAAPSNDAVFTAPATVSLEASLTGGDGAPRVVQFFQGEIKIGEDNLPPYVFNWTGVTPGTYTITARTTNSLGIVQSTDPVRVFVVGSGGALAGSFSPSSGSVNLTTEGGKDWAHWGLLRKTSFNRKLNAPSQISNFTEIGKGRMDQYGDNIVNFSWSDGAPTLAVSGTTTGIFVDGLGNGFEFTLPADRTLRRFKIYVGLYGARGVFEAILSDLSAAPFIHSSFQSVYNSATAVYTIEYAAASPGQTLTVRYTSGALFDEDWGNVTLQAATLTHISPVMNTTVSGSLNPINLSFPTEVGWNYFLQYTDSLTTPNWLPLTNVVGNGSPISFLETGPGASNRFYRVQMSK